MSKRKTPHEVEEEKPTPVLSISSTGVAVVKSLPRRIQVVRSNRLVPQKPRAPVPIPQGRRYPQPQARAPALSPLDYEEEVTVDVVQALNDSQRVSTSAEEEEVRVVDGMEEELDLAEMQVLAPRPKPKKPRAYGRFAANTGPAPHLHKYVTYEEFNRQKSLIEESGHLSKEEKSKERKRIADSFEKQKKTLAARILSEQANQVVDLIAAHPEVLNERMTQIILDTTANYFKDHYGKDIVEEAERVRETTRTNPHLRESASYSLRHPSFHQ